MGVQKVHIYLNKVVYWLNVIYVKLNKFQKLIHRPEMNEMKYNIYIYNYKSVHTKVKVMMAFKARTFSPSM